MAETNGASAGREALFLRAYDLRVSYGVNVNGVANHLHRMTLKTNASRPFRLASSAYMEALSSWSKRLEVPVDASVAAYFATTESAHKAIMDVETQFNDNLESSLITNGGDLRLLSVARIATLFEVSTSCIKNWASEDRMDATNEGRPLRVDEDSLRDFYQWQYPQNYDPDAAVRML